MTSETIDITSNTNLVSDNGIRVDRTDYNTGIIINIPSMCVTRFLTLNFTGVESLKDIIRIYFKNDISSNLTVMIRWPSNQVSNLILCPESETDVNIRYYIMTQDARNVYEITSAWMLQEEGRGEEREYCGKEIITREENDTTTIITTPIRKLTPEEKNAKILQKAIYYIATRLVLLNKFDRYRNPVPTGAGSILKEEKENIEKGGVDWLSIFLLIVGLAVILYNMIKIIY